MSSINLRDFELAALAVTSGGRGDVAGAPTLAQATAYIQQLTGLPDAYALIMQLLLSTQQSAARFFCLQALTGFVSSSSYDSLNGARRAELRGALLSWGAACSRAEPSYVRTKLAVLLAHIVRADFPREWPTAFADLAWALTGNATSFIALGQSPPAGAPPPPAASSAAAALAGADLFIRILGALQEDLVDAHINRSAAESAANMHVKDAMRHTSVMPPLVECVCGIVAAGAAAAGPTEQKQQQSSTGSSSSSSSSSEAVTAARVAARGLDVLAEYASWIDIRLLANEAVMALVFRILAPAAAAAAASAASAAGGSDATSSQASEPRSLSDVALNSPPARLRAPALRLLHQLQYKGMNDSSRVGLIQATRTVEILTALLAPPGMGAGAVAAAAVAVGGSSRAAAAHDNNIGMRLFPRAAASARAAAAVIVTSGLYNGSGAGSSSSSFVDGPPHSSHFAAATASATAVDADDIDADGEDDGDDAFCGALVSLLCLTGQSLLSAGEAPDVVLGALASAGGDGGLHWLAYAIRTVLALAVDVVGVQHPGGQSTAVSTVAAIGTGGMNGGLPYSGGGGGGAAFGTRSAAASGGSEDGEESEEEEEEAMERQADVAAAIAGVMPLLNDAIAALNREVKGAAAVPSAGAAAAAAGTAPSRVSLSPMMMSVQATPSLMRVISNGNFNLGPSSISPAPPATSSSPTPFFSSLGDGLAGVAAEGADAAAAAGGGGGGGRKQSPPTLPKAFEGRPAGVSMGEPLLLSRFCALLPQAWQLYPRGFDFNRAGTAAAAGGAAMPPPRGNSTALDSGSRAGAGAPDGEVPHLQLEDENEEAICETRDLLRRAFVNLCRTAPDAVMGLLAERGGGGEGDSAAPAAVGAPSPAALTSPHAAAVSAAALSRRSSSPSGDGANGGSSGGGVFSPEFLSHLRFAPPAAADAALSLLYAYGEGAPGVATAAAQWSAGGTAAAARGPPPSALAGATAVPAGAAATGVCAVPAHARQLGEALFALFSSGYASAEAPPPAPAASSFSSFGNHQGAPQQQQHPPPAPHLLLQYYEIAARYAIVLASRPALLGALMNDLCGVRGLRHSDPRVRSRSAFLLLKSVKAVFRGINSGGGGGGGGGSHDFAPLLPGLLNGVAEFLTVAFVPPASLHSAAAAAAAAQRQQLLQQSPTRNATGAGAFTSTSATAAGAPTPTSPAAAATAASARYSTRGPSGLGPDDAAFLFELVGLVLGQHWVRMEQREAYAEAVEAPLLGQLEEGVASLARAVDSSSNSSSGGGGGNTNSNASTGTAWSPEFMSDVAAWVVRALNALGYIGKGLGSVSASPRLSALTVRATVAALAGVRVLPGHAGVRAKTLFLLHRAVDALDAGDVLRILLGTPQAPADFSGGGGSGGAAASAPGGLSLLLCAPASPSPDDMNAILILLNQVIARLKGGVVPLLAEWLIPVVYRVGAVMPPPPVRQLRAAASANTPAAAAAAGSSSAPSSGVPVAIPSASFSASAAAVSVPTDSDAAAVARSRNELSRTYLTFLLAIVNGGLTGSVFLSERPLSDAAAAAVASATASSSSSSSSSAGAGAAAAARSWGGGSGAAVAAATAPAGGPNAARLLDTFLPSICSLVTTAGDASVARCGLSLSTALVKTLLPCALPTKAAAASPADSSGGVALGSAKTKGAAQGVTAASASTANAASTALGATPLPSPLPPPLQAPVLQFLTGPLLSSSLSFMATAPVFECAGSSGSAMALGGDAQTLGAAGDAVALHIALAVHISAVTGTPQGNAGGDVIAHLASVLLPSMGCPVDIAHGYGEKLRLSVAAGGYHTSGSSGGGGAAAAALKDARMAYLAVARALRNTL